MSKKSNSKRDTSSDASDEHAEQVDNNEDDGMEDAAADGKWDLAKKLRKNTRLMCMGEGCSNRAVATWVNLSTSEEWHGCQECQEKEFGPEEDEGDDAATDSGRSAGSTRDVSGTETDASERADAADSTSGGKSEEASVTQVNERSEKDENSPAFAIESSDDSDKSNEPNDKVSDHGDVRDSASGENSDDREVDEASSIDEPKNKGSTPLDYDEKTCTVVEGQDIRSSVVTDTDSDAPAAERAGKSEIVSDHRACKDRTRENEDETPSSSMEPPLEGTEEETGGEVAKSLDNDEKNEKEPDEDSEENMHEDEDGAEEQWDLKKVFTESEILAPNPVLCDGEDCGLRACSLWISNEDTKWNSCLDCQELDFEGWPPKGKELPIDHMDATHRLTIAEHCTKQDRPKMPNVPCKKGPAKGASTFTTPKSKVSDVQSVPSTAVEHSEDDGGRTSASSNPPRKSANATVTPSPKSKNLGSSVKPKQPSAAALAMHRKWQEAAESMGGPDARIVVSKPKAKAIIFDMMHEAFRPMNITEIYKNLKAVIPSPVLKSCLDDMAMGTKLSDENLFAESDDEEDDGKAGKLIKATSSRTSGDCEEDTYNQSLGVKTGRNANTTLYFVDHSRLHNNGDGLLPDEKNKLQVDLQSSKTEEDSLMESLRCVDSETSNLLSEPTNEEASSSLDCAETAMMDLQKELEDCRGFADNARHRKRLRVRIESVTEHWRKRRRMCMDFLFAMEESTEGSFSAKKCLAGGDGGGPIEIDSDEAVVAGAIAFGKKKRARGTNIRSNSCSKRQARGSKGCLSKPIGSENFVAVQLGMHGTVMRVLLDEAEN